MTADGRMVVVVKGAAIEAADCKLHTNPVPLNPKF